MLRQGCAAAASWPSGSLDTGRDPRAADHAQKGLSGSGPTGFSAGFAAAGAVFAAGVDGAASGVVAAWASGPLPGFAAASGETFPGAGAGPGAAVVFPSVPSALACAPCT